MSSHPDAPRIEEALFAAADETPSATAIMDAATSTSVTYGELAAWAGQFAAKLAEHGLSPGDRVAMYFDKTVESIVALYGTWAAGGVAVPANGSLKTAQVKHIVDHSQARLFVSTDRKLASVSEDAAAGAQSLTVPPFDPGARARVALALPDGRTLSTILYTSGSTGLPKGIAFTHENLVAGARIVTSYLGITSAERILSVLPFSFDYGLNQLLTSVSQRAVLVLQRSPMPGDICRSLERFEITGLAGVPPLWIQLMQDTSPLPTMALPALRYITNSGGVFPADVVKRYRTAFPHTRVFLMYGLTEAFRSTYLPPDEIDRRPTSMGKAIPECEVLVVREDGQECAPGEVGELIHSGPTVTLGYWNDPAATALKFKPNPLRPGVVAVFSGDYVKKDDEGFLYFVGRRDEMIKSQGYRISPAEVEAIIHASGLVAEVVVKSRPDPVAGAIVVAYCVPTSGGAFDTNALLAYCKKEMPNHMVPREINVCEAFPRTSSGKIDRATVGSSAS